jgi:hypothetical protein
MQVPESRLASLRGIRASASLLAGFLRCSMAHQPEFCAFALTQGKHRPARVD